MCPDIDLISDYYRLKNSYTTHSDRFSFSIEIITCNKEIHSECAEEDKIIEFLDYLLLTQYFLTESVDFLN